MVSRESRARQFLPFDALNGFEEALREKEIEYEEKIELTDEVKEEISNVLYQIEKGDNIKIRYYHRNKYVDIIGTVKKVDKIKKKVVFLNEVKVDIENIIKIKRCS